MYGLILDFALNDDRIRAVGMEGSRTNPNVPRDIFQDYDVSYLVTDMGSFRADDAWLDIFGERIIMQQPESMSLFPPELGNWYSYLMLFTDGTRIDLKLIPLEEADLYRKSDKLLKILVDKDGLFLAMAKPTDEDYHVKRPSKEHFADCCNEFWWVSTYVAKGLWRQEILYAIDHINLYVRPALLRMLQWKVGFATGFSVSIGKNNKYLSQYIAKESWDLLLDTYKNSTYGDCWQALFTMADLFRQTALCVGEQAGYAYKWDDDRNVMAYLKWVRGLER